MATASHLDMHRDHLRWRADDDMWRDDLANWETEVRQAVNDLPRLEIAMQAHIELLRNHAAAVRLYEQDFNHHEHALAEYEVGAEGTELVQLAKGHHAAAEKHAQHLRRHEELKRQHHELLARWRLLTAGLIVQEKSHNPKVIQ